MMRRDSEAHRAAAGGHQTAEELLTTTGAAPLSIYFDATGTTSQATARPFDEIQYTWNFGESTGPGVAKWSQGANAGVASRNADRGPIAGHVYETPGTYTATLTAFDGVNSASKGAVPLKLKSIERREKDALFPRCRVRVARVRATWNEGLGSGGNDELAAPQLHDNDDRSRVGRPNRDRNVA